MEIDLKNYKHYEIYRGLVNGSNIGHLKRFNLIVGDVNLDSSKIESFKDFKVEIVTGYFSCSYCNNLESLEGLPIIKDDLYCQNLPRLNLKQSFTAILNSGILVENICCDDDLRLYLQFAKSPNDFVKLRGFNLKLKEKINKIVNFKEF